MPLCMTLLLLLLLLLIIIIGLLISACEIKRNIYIPQKPQECSLFVFPFLDVLGVKTNCLLGAVPERVKTPECGDTQRN